MLVYQIWHLLVLGNMGLRIGANVNLNKHELETALWLSTHFGIAEVVRADFERFSDGHRGSQNTE
jgi:hypothetical protein